MDASALVAGDPEFDLNRGDRVGGGVGAHPSTSQSFTLMTPIVWSPSMTPRTVAGLC